MLKPVFLEIQIPFFMVTGAMFMLL